MIEQAQNDKLNSEEAIAKINSDYEKFNQIVVRENISQFQKKRKHNEIEEESQVPAPERSAN